MWLIVYVLLFYVLSLDFAFFLPYIRQKIEGYETDFYNLLFTLYSNGCL